MAKTVITSTTNSIKVVFNDDSTLVGMDKGTWVKANIDAFNNPKRSTSLGAIL